jgi:hypothetical protein
MVIMGPSTAPSEKTSVSTMPRTSITSGSPCETHLVIRALARHYQPVLFVGHERARNPCRTLGESSCAVIEETSVKSNPRDSSHFCWARAVNARGAASWP